MGDRTAIIVDYTLFKTVWEDTFQCFIPTSIQIVEDAQYFFHSISWPTVAHRGPPYCPSTDQSLLPVQVKWENALETGEGKEDAEKALAEMAAYPAGVQERSAEALQRP